MSSSGTCSRPLGTEVRFSHRIAFAFEQATDNAIADNISWLDFTHALTFANSCRHLCEERPELWPRALLQMALFVGRNRKYVSAEQDISRWRVNWALKSSRRPIRTS